MIRHLVLENFKAFGERTAISLAPITLIYGQNSAGKSSILQSLSLLKQSRGTRDTQALLLPRSDTGLVDLGSFREMVFDHELSRVLRIRLVVQGYGQRLPFLDSKPRAVAQGLEFAFSRRSQNEEISLERLEVCGGDPHRFIAGFTAKNQPRYTSSDPDSELYNFGRYLGSRYIDLAASNHQEFQIAEFGQDANSFYVEVFKKIREWRAHVQADVERLADEVSLSSLRLRYSSQSSAQRSAEVEEAGQVLDLLLNIDKYTDKDVGKWIANKAKGTRLFLDGFIPVGSDQGASPSIVDYELSRIFRSAPSEIRGLTDSIGSLAASTGRVIDETLGSIFQIGPFRRAPERWYVFTGTTPRDVGYQGHLLPDLLFRKHSLVDETNEWMDRLDLGYRISVDPIGMPGSDLFELRLFDTRREPQVSVGLSDVGFGISQILPLVVQSLVAENQVITVEQPEVHIHPKLQADLGDLLAHSIRRPLHNQFLVETHSEHLALRVQKLVRTKKLRPSDVSIIFVQRDKNGSRVIPIRLDEDGDFMDEFPGGFFPERLREL